ncbi:hypothetical protein V8F20_010518 [Naviculisporaceae sp. PSN 640]
MFTDERWTGTPRVRRRGDRHDHPSLSTELPPLPSVVYSVPMEPAAAVQLASESLALCSKVITELKKFAQAEKHLKALIKNVERVRQSSELLLTVIPRSARLARAAEIVAGQPKLGLVRRLQWTITQSQTEELVSNMKKVEERIQYNVNLLTLWASMRHLSIAQEVKETEARLANIPGIQDAFSTAETEVDESTHGNQMQMVPEANQAVKSTARPALRTWLGYNMTSGHDPQYLRHREALSDAAYYGRWEDVFRIIELGNTLYGESWVNATRIRQSTDPKAPSFWAPIHQAAYWRAPLEVFEHLIALGASRTVRTKRTKFAWPNMSALELATEFHDLILRENNWLDKNRIHLPVLEVLTEYEPGSTWFPIRLEAGRESGYMYRLDSRHLLVWSVNVVAPGTNTKYRITEEEVFEVHEALVFPVSG